MNHQLYRKHTKRIKSFLLGNLLFYFLEIELRISHIPSPQLLTTSARLQNYKEGQCSNKENTEPSYNEFNSSLNHHRTVENKHWLRLQDPLLMHAAVLGNIPESELCSSSSRSLLFRLFCRFFETRKRRYPVILQMLLTNRVPVPTKQQFYHLPGEYHGNLNKNKRFRYM